MKKKNGTEPSFPFVDTGLKTARKEYFETAHENLDNLAFPSRQDPVAAVQS